MASGQTPSAENCLEFMLEFANKEAPKVSKDSRIVIPRDAILLNWRALPNQEASGQKDSVLGRRRTS